LRLDAGHRLDLCPACTPLAGRSQLGRLPALVRPNLATDIDPAALPIPVPTLLLQPLIENAIRHGFADGQEPLSLEISARLTGERLTIRVVNSGRWVEPEERGGIGLANIRRRLKLLYSGSASLELEKDVDRVAVQIDLPVTPTPAAAQ